MHMEFLEFSEYSKILYDRIRKVDPENVRKIIGYLFIHDNADRDMTQLAFGPEDTIHEVVETAKSQMHFLALPSFSIPFRVSTPSPSSIPLALPRNNRHFSPCPATSYDQEHHTTNQHSPDYMSPCYTDQSPYFCFKDHIEPLNARLSGYDCSYADNVAMINNIARTAQQYSAGTEFKPKVCHYYIKGFCKHGNNCRYLHGSPCESYGQIYNINAVYDDHMFRPGTLETLEREIVELLKARRGSPISIASLPMIYFENYGRILQADGYLTESQRHGKSGYSLTKLLTRLKSSILVIDRPHGQHSIILAEDASKYTDHRKNDHCPTVCSARQIYMTFPAESVFTEDDVSDYFSKRYGPVYDVRIPCQQNRMFGFVTFHNTDTVKQILSDDREHIIAGSRVLVKTYRDKGKCSERKAQERIEQQQQQQQQSRTYYSPQFQNLESQLHSIQRDQYEANRMLRLKFQEQQQQQQQQQLQALKVERMLLETRLMEKSVINQPCFSNQIQEPQVPQTFDDMLDVQKTSVCDIRGRSGPGSPSITDENKLSINSDEWSHIVRSLDREYTLPESPFESSIDDINK